MLILVLGTAAAEVINLPSIPWPFGDIQVAIAMTSVTLSVCLSSFGIISLPSIPWTFRTYR